MIDIIQRYWQKALFASMSMVILGSSISCQKDFLQVPPGGNPTVDTIFNQSANAYNATGSVRGVYAYGCDLFRKRMECAIMVEAARMLEEQE